ncbi:MAG TPA: hypothetical protein VHZ97_21530 [Pseudonocardiaceae bacterium]|jgi:hypothetical protein|nr:hypothetical protein [Pseudonocardiaceae bacterium]
MPRRWVLGLVGVALGLVGTGCAAPSTPGPAATSTTTRAPETTTKTLGPGAGLNWALLMCLTTFEVDETAGPLSELNSFDNDFPNSLNRIQAAKQTVDTIAATGVPDLDNLTNTLRQSIDGAEPQISTLLNTAISGHPNGVVDQVTQLVSGIHPNSTDLYNAAQSTPDVGQAYRSATSCPTSPIG